MSTCSFVAAAPPSAVNSDTSNASVTSPDIPPPLKPVPAVTPVISPTGKLETKTFFVLLSVTS